MFHVRRLCFLVVALALVAISCSPDAESLPSLSSEAPTTTADPDSLAFADEEPEEETVQQHELRLGVPDLRIVAPSSLNEVDPTEVLIADLLADGLVELDRPTGQIHAALAESWTVSDDRLVWTFAIADETFSDGTPIEADDVAETIAAVARLGNESLSGPTLAVIDGYAAVAAGEEDDLSGLVIVDAETLEIHLAYQYEPLLEMLAGAQFGVTPASGTDVDGLPISSSQDFAVSDMTETTLVLNARDDESQITKITIASDPDGALLARGEVDLGFGLQPDDQFDGLEVLSFPRSADAFYAFNAGAAPLDDPAVRQAIMQAVDSAALVEQFLPAASPMTGFVAGGGDACVELCAHDVDAATAAVHAAGATGLEFAVDFFVTEGDDVEQRLAESIVSQLRDVGLVATARTHSIEDYGRLVASDELDMFRFGSASALLSLDAELAPAFTTLGPDNVTGTSELEFDELIVEARTTQTAAVRNMLYAKAERVLFEQAVVLPLATFQHHLVLAPSVTDAHVNADGSLDLESVVFG